MDKPQFVYVTYILTTSEKVWTALTDAELSARYWGRSNRSDWKVGSAWSHGHAGEAPDVTGKVLEADPPRRLVTSWFRPAEAGDPAQHSRVTYEIEQMGEKVRLTVTHTELTEDALRDISGGWPAVLSNLKTFLETGRTIPDPFSTLACQQAEAATA